MLPPNDEKSPVDEPAAREISPPFELEEPVSKRIEPGVVSSAELDVEISIFPLLLALEDPVKRDRLPLLPNLDELVDNDT